MILYNKKLRSLHQVSFLGMTKQEVSDILGEGCYDSDSKTWYYKVHTTFWGRKTIFVVGFRDDNIVEFKLTKYVYWPR